MKSNTLLRTISLLLFLSFVKITLGQGVPEVLYYRFNGTSKSIRNQASNPPSGTSTATIYGTLYQGSSGTCGGTALVGNGNLSTTDYVDTKWATATSGSWTISFWTNNLDSSTALFYIFSDLSAGAFRCFTGGIAGAGNILLRGTFSDVLLTGGSSTKPAVSTFVYDATAGFIYAYLNGKLINSVSQSSISLSSTASLILSGYNSLAGLNAGGLMDEFRFYSKALSAADVAKLAYTGNTTGTLTQTSKCSFTGPSGTHTWNRTGNFKDTLPNYYNCDSVISVNLTITGNSVATISPTACDFYVNPSKSTIYTKSGSYSDIIPNKAGCDSIITIKLIIKYSKTANFTISTCYQYKSPSGKYIWTSSGAYSDTIVNKVGCDSIMNFKLTINNRVFATATVKKCDSYKSPSGKYLWKTTGNYKDTINTSKGCDSVITTNLTIIKSSTHSFSTKVCEKYKSPSGKTLSLSGIYIDTLVNNKGCDSFITINLTVNKKSFSFLFLQGCESYRSPSGKYLWTISGTYDDTIPNRAGCDSIMFIDLRINKQTSSTFFKTNCINFRSPSGKYLWTKSGKYSDTIASKRGCDSVITFNLTILNVNVTVIQHDPLLTAETIGAAYQWLNCKTNYSAISGETGRSFSAKTIGDYAVAVTENACTDTSACISVTKLSIDKTVLKDNITLYPNPSNGLVNIYCASPLNNARIQLINSLGEIIFSATNIYGNEASFNTSALAAGIYYVEIMEKGNIARIKLSKY